VADGRAPEAGGDESHGHGDERRDELEELRQPERVGLVQDVERGKYATNAIGITKARKRRSHWSYTLIGYWVRNCPPYVNAFAVSRPSTVQKTMQMTPTQTAPKIALAETTARKSIATRPAVQSMSSDASA
jgi:hypothetical protein